MGRLSVYGGSTGSTLTVSTTETLTINGKDYGGYVTKTIPNVINVVRRIDTILHTSEVAIANFGDTVSAEFAVKIDSGCSLSIFGDIGDTGSTGGFKSMFDAKETALTVALDHLKSITALADTASVDLELYIAMI